MFFFNFKENVEVTQVSATSYLKVQIIFKIIAEKKNTIKKYNKNIQSGYRLYYIVICTFCTQVIFFKSVISKMNKKIQIQFADYKVKKIMILQAVRFPIVLGLLQQIDAKDLYLNYVL